MIYIQHWIYATLTPYDSKTSGTNEVCVKLIKQMNGNSINSLLNLFNTIYNAGTILHQWLLFVSVMILKQSLWQKLLRLSMNFTYIKYCTIHIALRYGLLKITTLKALRVLRCDVIMDGENLRIYKIRNTEVLYQIYKKSVLIYIKKKKLQN